MPTNDPNGLQYMLGGAKYGLNSPFITSNNPPAPSTANKLGYLGLSGTNSATYTPPPAGTATVDNPGVFVPSQQLVENKGTPAAFSPGGGSYGFNPLASAPGNTNTTTGASTPNSFGFNPIPGAGTTAGQATYGQAGGVAGGKQPYQQSTGLPMPSSTLPQPEGMLGFISPRDNVIDAMAQRQRPNLSMYSPLRGLFNIGNR